MVLKKRVRSEEILNVEAGRELTESELTAICGGGKSANGLPSLASLLIPQSSPTKAHAGENNGFANFNGLDPLTGITSSLLGTVI